MTDFNLEQLKHQFHLFSPGDLAGVRYFFAPGRVNLIGEHTDYNGGFVLPAALELGTLLMVRPRQDGVFRFLSTTFKGTVEISGSDLSYNESHGFANYPKGVIQVLQSEGVSCGGGDFLYDSNLPSGAGLSSSAAIEVVTALAVTALAGVEMARPRLALIAQRAENEYVGVQCGIMDQFSVAVGKQSHAVLLNCQTLDYQYVPLDLADYVMVITNSNKQRMLSESKYNERRDECNRALEQLQHVMPNLKHLCDLDVETWRMHRKVITEDKLARRAEHVVTENHRTHQAVKALQNGDMSAFGALLRASHESLRDNYEVTGTELDVLANAAWTAPGCIGSRMTGAGFGGCTISLVEQDAVPLFEAHVRSEYERQVGYPPSFYESKAGHGVSER